MTQKILSGLHLAAWYGMAPNMPSDKPVCNVYALPTPRGVVLIDCGPAYTFSLVEQNLGLLGFSPSDVKYALLTHPHMDHCGAGHLFQKAGTKLFASPYTAMVMEKEPRQVLYEDPAQVVPTRVDQVVPQEGRLDVGGLAVRVLFTPGHTPGCTSYLVGVGQEKCLFSGDLVVPVDRGVCPMGWAGSVGFSRESTLVSLKKMAGLDFQHLLGGHGYVIGDGKSCLERTIQFWERGTIGPTNPFVLKNGKTLEKIS